MEKKTSKQPKAASRYRQLLRTEKSLLRIVPLVEKTHLITRQYQNRRKLRKVNL